MANDADLIKLYSKRILALTTTPGLRNRLEAPDVSAKKRAPLCGSTITVDLQITEGRISAYGQDVKACALGQAAAALLSQNVVGRSRAEIEAARDALKAMLSADGPVPEAPFDGFEVLMAARDFHNRHASIMLSLEATAEAMATAENAACA